MIYPQRADILELLKEYKVLSTSQFYVLAGFPRAWDPDNEDQRNLRKKLQVGEKAGLWNSRRYLKGEIYGRPQTEKAYFFKERRPTSLAHEVSISDVHISLKPEFWIQEDLKHGINPDAFFYVAPYFYFLEVEKQPNNFTKRSGVVKKCERYEAFRKAGEFNAYDESMKDFILLIVVENEERKTNLLKALPPYGMYRIATLQDVISNGYGEIWSSPNGRQYALR